ncbi:UNVERIFIED_CONTAM: hypothetical protein FKN15_002900 [Acipenser sinensis]
MKRLEYEESPARLQSCSSVPHICRVSGEYCFSAMVVQGVPIHPQTNQSLLQHTARVNLLPQLIQDKTLDGIITKTGGSNFTKDIEEEMGMGINRAKRLSGIPDGGSREEGHGFYSFRENLGQHDQELRKLCGSTSKLEVLLLRSRGKQSNKNTAATTQSNP